MNNKDHIETNILLRNNTPMDDFLGLTPNQMHDLLYDTLGENSPVKFNEQIDNETLDNIPLFCIAEVYLKIIERDKQIKLTPLGALPKKVVVEVYDKKFLPDEYIERGIYKLWREQDCISILSARLTLEIAGLVKKANGKVTLTKKGQLYLKTENRSQLFKIFFQAFADKFLWSFNDAYPAQHVGQIGWAFSALMLNKFGDKEQTANFYAEKYLGAFPKSLLFFSDNYGTKEQDFSRCYGVRTFQRFLVWFGFVKINKQKNYSDIATDNFLRSNVLEKVFTFDEG